MNVGKRNVSDKLADQLTGTSQTPFNSERNRSPFPKVDSISPKTAAMVRGNLSGSKGAVPTMNVPPGGRGLNYKDWGQGAHRTVNIEGSRKSSRTRAQGKIHQSAFHNQ